MSEISDEEAREILWASSEQGMAAVRAAWDKAQDLDRDYSRYVTCRLTEADIAAVVYAAYQAGDNEKIK